MGNPINRPGDAGTPRATASGVQVQMHREPISPPARKTYYLTGYVRIDAASDDEAVAKFEAAGPLGIEVEIADGVVLDFQGPWDDVVETNERACICPPGLVQRGGFKGGCPIHA